MMNVEKGISIAEFFSYVVMIFGVLVDHVTTYRGLEHGMFESNFLVEYLLDAGAWIFLDAALVVGVVATSYVVARTSDMGRLDLIFPLILGVVRLAAGLWNLNILI